MQEESSDKSPLKFGEFGMRRQSVFHVIGARLECRQQVAMTPREIFKDTGQLIGCCLRVQPQDTIDDMIRPRPVDFVQIPWLDRRPERAHEDPRWVRAQTKRLPVQKWRL